MEGKSLLLGFIFAVGIFAWKSGVGLFYLLSSRRTGWSKLLVPTSYALLYLALFAGVAVLVRHSDRLASLTLPEKMLSYGMPLHGLMSTVLAAWGIRLLRQRPTAAEPSRGWLVLVMPCPVCMTVIGITVVLLVSFFPNNSFVFITVAYLLFIGIGFSSTAALAYWNRSRRVRANDILGSAMLMVGAYFFLSAVFMPFFQELETVYRLAVGKQSDSTGDWRHRLTIGAAALIVAAVGYYRQQQAMRR